MDCFCAGRLAVDDQAKFQYPLFRIVDCFDALAGSPSMIRQSFNIRSFGSWIASRPRRHQRQRGQWFQYPLFRIVDCFAGCWVSRCQRVSVSISALSDRGLLPCCRQPTSAQTAPVSISALSDRGLLLCFKQCTLRNIVSFNIRSFGSWIASTTLDLAMAVESAFQYPLFRIVDCFLA